MKYKLQDTYGGIYEYEVPDGTSEYYVIAEASRKEGKPLSRYMGGESTKSEGSSHEAMYHTESELRKKSEQAHSEERERSKSLERQIEKLTGDLDAVKKEARKKSDHAYQLTLAENQHGVTKRELATANEARIASEERCKKLLAELEASKTPKPSPTGWNMEIVTRDHNGLAKRIHFEAEYKALH